MAAEQHVQRMTLDEYWQLEETSEFRHEYIDGYVYDLAGGTTTHSIISVNAVTALNQELQSGPCQVFSSHMRVKINNNCYMYPDVTVSCDIAETRKKKTTLQSPRLVIEVLSPSTATYDRTVKLARYQEKDSIQEYAIISTTQQLVELYRREASGEWSCQHYTTGQVVDFTSIDVQVAISTLYNHADLSE